MAKKKKSKKKDDVWPGMPRKAHTALSCYIDRVANSIGLTQWELTLAETPTEDTNMAHINCTFGRHCAVISVCEDWMNQSIEERRHTVMHELVHCFLDKPTSFVENDLGALLGKPAHTVLVEAYKMEVEFATDELAKALVHFSDDSEVVHYLEGRLKP